MSDLPTAIEVKSVIQTDRDNAIVDAFIVDARLLVIPHISELEEDVRKAIIKWTAAHLIASTWEADKSSKSLGDGTNTYAKAKLGKYLNGTTYGQQAITLDPSGNLANLAKPSLQIAKLKVIG